MDQEDLSRRLEEVLPHRLGRPPLHLLGPVEAFTGGWASSQLLRRLARAPADPWHEVEQAELPAWG